MKGWVKYFSSKTSVVFFRGKRFAVISQTIEANGDQDLNVNKMHNKSIKYLHTVHANQCKCPESQTGNVALKNITDTMFSALHVCHVFAYVNKAPILESTGYSKQCGKKQVVCDVL